jgi:hypothetical protein
MTTFIVRQYEENTKVYIMFFFLLFFFNLQVLMKSPLYKIYIKSIVQLCGVKFIRLLYKRCIFSTKIINVLNLIIIN